MSDGQHGAAGVSPPAGWTVLPDGRLLPVDGSTVHSGGVSLVDAPQEGGPAQVPGQGAEAIVCLRGPDQPPVFQGALNGDGTVTLLSSDGQLLGRGSFADSGKALDVTLADGETETIDLRGTTLEVANGERSSAYTVDGDGQLHLVALSVLSDGHLKVHVGGQVLPIAAGAIVTLDHVGRVFVNGSLVVNGPVVVQKRSSVLQRPEHVTVRTQGVQTVIDWNAVHRLASQVVWDVDDMRAFSKNMSGHGEDVANAGTILSSNTDGLEGSFGNDPIGQQFQVAYGDARSGGLALWQSIMVLSSNLSDTADGLGRSAQVLLDTENQNLANLSIPFQISDPSPTGSPGGRYGRGHVQ